MARQVAVRRKYNYISTFYPEEGKLSRHNYPKHMRFFKEGAEHRERCFLAANRIGKCLPLDAPVMMGDGSWRELRWIIEGDYVMGYDLQTGRAFPVKVTEVTRSGDMEVFETTFSDGGAMRCTWEHWMPGRTRSGRAQNSHGKKVPVSPKKRRFNEYVKSVDNAISSRHSFLSPRLVDYLQVKRLPLHPYVVGALLGDGSLNKEGVVFTTADTDILGKVLCLVDDLVDCVTRHKDPLCYTLKQKRDGKYGLLSNALREIGLSKVRCHEKHIPEIYLTASRDDRMELLAGLVDTDGTHNEFTQKSERLVRDFARLVRSLGGKASVARSVKTCTNASGGPRAGEYWRCTWRLNERLPLVLERKQPRISKRPVDYSRRVIRKVASLGMMPCGCITVDHPDHCFIAYDWVAVGNTEGVGGYEVVCHATGIYPTWWQGKKFRHPVKIWVAGDTGTTVRDIIQYKLLGPVTDMGTGLIPKSLLHGKPRPKSGNVPDLMETIYVKHVTGGVSKIVQKSYKEGRISFQGTEQDVVWLDEEPPLSIYAECLLRTMTTNGLVICTFTPLEGMTEVVMLYLQDGKIPENGIVYSESTKVIVEGA